MAGAATNIKMMACKTSIISIGILETTIMRVAPLRKMPNKSDASTTPKGWLLPIYARAMLSNP